MYVCVIAELSYHLACTIMLLNIFLFLHSITNLKHVQITVPRKS